VSPLVLKIKMIRSSKDKARGNFSPAFRYIFLFHEALQKGYSQKRVKMASVLQLG